MWQGGGAECGLSILSAVLRWAGGGCAVGSMSVS